MTQPLPPYSDKPVCPKCAYTEAFTDYKAEGEPRSGGFFGSGQPERLERCCARCDFVWDEALNRPKEQ